MPPGGHDEHGSFEQITKQRAQALHAHILSQPAERFRNQPEALLDAIDAFSTAQRVPMIFRRAKLDVARRALAAMARPPKVLLEFGTFVGNSALGWGAILRELNNNGGEGASKDVHVYGFELDPEFARIARDFVELAGLSDVVHVVEGPGAESLRRLHAEGKVKEGGVDVVFLDHWEDLYLPDLQLCEELKLLRPGSLVIADNTDFPGAPKYLEYVRKGGSGEPGAVRYRTESVEAETDSRGPKFVEITTVL